MANSVSLTDDMARATPVPHPDHGRELLQSFIGELGWTALEVATALGVSNATMSEWLNGHGRPRHPFRVAIEKWSHGRVPAGAWETKEERAIQTRPEPARKRTGS